MSDDPRAGVPDATTHIRTGQLITVDGSAGAVTPT
jgi:phosphohistidine swiveling domain-containing protein